MMRPASRSWRTSAVSLWCVLITAAALAPTAAPPDSMRSGRRVPWARTTFSAVRPRSAHMASVTRMKVSPMILRFSSGEVFCASGGVVLPLISVVEAAKSSAKSVLPSMFTPTSRSATCTPDDSSCRMKPWSMCRLITRSAPSALFSSAAHTWLGRGLGLGLGLGFGQG